MSHLLEALKRLETKASESSSEQDSSSVDVDRTNDTILLNSELIEASVESVANECEDEGSELLEPVEAELVEQVEPQEIEKLKPSAEDKPTTDNETSEEEQIPEEVSSQPSQTMDLTDLPSPENNEHTPADEPSVEGDEHEVIETTEPDEPPVTSTLVLEDRPIVDPEPETPAEQEDQHDVEVESADEPTVEETSVASEPIENTEASPEPSELNTLDEDHAQETPDSQHSEPAELSVVDNYKSQPEEVNVPPAPMPPVQSLVSLAETLTRSSVAPRPAERTDFEVAIQNTLDDPSLRPQYEQLACEVGSKVPPELPVSMLFAAIDDAESTHTIAAVATLLADYSLGKVLVVDVASKEMKLTAGFNQADASGLAETLRDEQDWRKLTVHTSRHGLDLLPSGRAGLKNWSDLTSRFAVLMREMSNKYQFILVDAGGASESAALGLGRFCDLTYVVLDMWNTDSNIAESVAAKLRKTGSRLAGCVVVGTSNAA